MTDGDADDHEFSSGQGFDADYEEFTLDPPELTVDPATVDPVDTRVVTDELDRRNVASDQVDVEELIDVGLSYMRINRFEEATGTFERAARFAADESLEAQEAWVNKGAAHAELEEWDEAIGAYREALRIDDDSERAARFAADESPEAQEAWVNKGAAHAELEEWDEAIGAYREALRIDDDSEHAASAETNLAYALWNAGETEPALRHAERAVEIDPRFPQAWYNRGFFLRERGLNEEAVNAFDNAIRLGMQTADVLQEKAAALEELGEDEQAEEVAARAEELRQEREQELLDERGR